MISINKKGFFTILAVLISLDASAASFFDKPAPKPATPAAETAVLPTKEATEPAPPPPPEIIPAKAPEAEAVAQPAPQVVAKPAPAPKTRRKQREEDDALEHIDTREEITEMLLRRVRR
jgi:hypothetical protein